MRKAAWFLLTAGYLAAAGGLIALAADQINPDGIAYIQNARHYLAGRVDLAINSYWGPLLSWLLVPFLAAGVEPTLAARLMNIAWGLGFAAAAAVLTGQLAGRRWRLLGFACGLLLSLEIVAFPITPDLLLACILGWYFVLSLRLFRGQGGWGTAIACGLLGGLAYLAKNYALPFVATHLAMTYALGLYIRRRDKNLSLEGRGRPEGPDEGEGHPPGRYWLAAAAALAIVSLPWVTIISQHDGQITIGSSGRLTRAAYAPLTDVGEDPIHSLQSPRPGRLTSWENPVEIRRDWQEWSPLSPSGLMRQAGVFALNCLLALYELATLDWLLLLALALPVGLKALPRAGQTPQSPPRIMLGWFLASALLYVLGYCLIHVESRLLLPAGGLLIAIAISLLTWLGAKLSQRAKSPMARRRFDLLPLLLAVSLIVGDLSTVRDLHQAAGDAARVRAIAGLPLPARPVAADFWRSGLHASYWAGRLYAGQFSAATADELAAQLRPLEPCTVLIFHDRKLAERLAEDDRFFLLGWQTDKSGRTIACIFYYLIVVR